MNKCLIFLTLTMLLMTGCSNHSHSFNENWSYDTESHWKDATCEHKDLSKDRGAHYDQDNNHICDICGYNIPLPPHEHTFSDEWSSNETSHWHAATCEHENFIKDMGEHIYIDDDGICDVCEFIINPPIPVKNLFLPAKVTYYDDFKQENENIITFSYDDDLLGYERISIKIKDDYNEEIVSEFRYNLDFTIETKIEKEYEVSDSKKEPVRNQKFIKEKLDQNGSYSLTMYEGNFENDEYTFFKKEISLFNNFNQPIFYSVSYENSDVPGTYYYDTYRTYEYDINHYLLTQKEFSNLNDENKTSYLQFLESYIYDENYTSGFKQEYYDSDGKGLLPCGYTEIEITHNETGRLIEGQNYEQDGKIGNFNYTQYDQKLREVHKYYGGLPEDIIHNYNEFDQLIHFENIEPSVEVIKVDLTYFANGGNLSNAKVVSENDYYIETDQSTFLYNEFDQLVNANKNIVFESKTDSTKEVYNDEVEIIYTTLQNDLLLSNMNYLNEILRKCTTYYIFDY